MQSFNFLVDQLVHKSLNLLHLLTLFLETLLFIIDVQKEHTQQLPRILVFLNNEALTDETHPVNEKQIANFW